MHAEVNFTQKDTQIQNRSGYIIVCVCVIVKRDIQESDEEAVRVKEQSILELGGLLAKTGQAAGNIMHTLATAFGDSKAISLVGMTALYYTV